MFYSSLQYNKVFTSEIVPLNKASSNKSQTEATSDNISTYVSKKTDTSHGSKKDKKKQTCKLCGL